MFASDPPSDRTPPDQELDLDQEVSTMARREARRLRGMRQLPTPADPAPVDAEAGPLLAAVARLRDDLEARLAEFEGIADTVPVIEQAKGVLMAREGCDAEEAFRMLRQASQRANTPLRELARQIVAATQRPAAD